MRDKTPLWLLILGVFGIVGTILSIAIGYDNQAGQWIFSSWQVAVSRIPVIALMSSVFIVGWRDMRRR